MLSETFALLLLLLQIFVRLSQVMFHHIFFGRTLIIWFLITIVDAGLFRLIARLVSYITLTNIIVTPFKPFLIRCSKTIWSINSSKSEMRFSQILLSLLSFGNSCKIHTFSVESRLISSLVWKFIVFSNNNMWLLDQLTKFRLCLIDVPVLFWLIDFILTSEIGYNNL